MKCKILLMAAALALPCTDALAVLGARCTSDRDCDFQEGEYCNPSHRCDLYNGGGNVGEHGGEYAELDSCKSDADCDADEPWINLGVGYQKSIDYGCSNGICIGVVRYRCAAGWYGNASWSASNVLSGCSSCPTNTGNVVATSDAGATNITQCFLPAGTVLYDEKGTYTYDTDCFYSE